MRILRSSPVAAVAVTGASGAAGLLEPTTGCLSLVLIALFTHLLGRGFGRLAAGIASLGIAGALLAPNHPPPDSGSISRCVIAIVAAWLCAELISRRRRQPGSPTRLKDEPFDLPIDQPGRNMWSRTGDGGLEYVSQSILDYLGRTFEELRNPYTLTHPDDAGIEAQAFARAKDTGEAQEYECRYRSAAGTYEWFAAVLHTQRDRSDRVFRVYGTHWNINKQKNEEEQLRQRNQTLQSISSLFPGHVWSALPNGSIEYLSPSLSEYTGIKDAHHCDLFRAAIHPDDLEANDRYWDALRAGNDPGELEFRLRRIDGVHRWFLCRVKAIKSESGQLLRWVGVGWDIHDRKTAEFLLRTEEETFRRIVDSVPACVCVGGPTGELLYVNKVGVAALGRPMEEIVGDGWMTYIHPDDVQAARQHWKAGIAAREPLDMAVRMLQHDGVYRWQRLLAEPSRCSNGDIINWYLIGIEIEETIKAQQTLAASEREARELLDRLPGRFATRTEHDFDFVSQQTLEETGTTLEGIKNRGYLSFIHPDDRDRVKEDYLRALQEKIPCDIDYRWAYRDGIYRWRHARSVPYFNEDGSVYKWYAVTVDIDDLYKSKEVIREREAQLNWLTENVPSLLWHADTQGRPEYVNKRSETYTGRRLDELRADGWYDLVHPEDAASTIEAWEESLRTGNPYDSIYRLRAADGSYRWFQCKATAMRDTEGEIVNWYGLATDIHERQLAEEALRKEERHLRRLVDAIPAMIWRATPAGDIDRWNFRMQAFAGKSWEKTDGQRFFCLVPEDDRGRVHARWLRAVREGASYQDTYQLMGGDGKLHWYLVRGEPFRDENGDILHWYCVCTDIGELKQTEAALQQREHQLREITETIPGMIWCNDPAGGLTFINRKTSEFVGLDISQLAGLGYRKTSHPDDLDSMVRAWTHSIETGEPYCHVARLRRKDGVYRWYQHTAEALRDSDGNIVQWYGLSLDIDELKQAEVAIQQREHQLRREIAEHIESKRKLRNYQDELIRTENLAVIGKMSAGLAHEINQPIAAMVTLSENALRFLQRGDRSTAEFNLSRIGELVARMGTLTGRLRSFARRPDGENTAVPLAPSIESAVTLLSHRLKKEQVERRVVAPSQPLLAFCEAVRLEQVFVNLVSNAIEAMETCETRAVEIRLYREGDRVVIEILDTGIGLSDTVQAKLFEPFFTTKKASGLGLGLAICSDIVASFGGSLTARNRPEGGALFRLMLRTVPEEETCK